MTTEAYIDRYFEETREILGRLDRQAVAAAVELLRQVRSAEGRLFILGIGGSAANASHAVNDFRKIGGIEAYAPTDNVAEFSARANDEGWETTFSQWLKGSRLRSEDAVMVLSVGGGSASASPNLIGALELARERGAKVLGIVGRDGGATVRAADVCILIPTVSPERITPHAESFQGVIWHLLVNALIQ
jgi:D-sedoheptulose 7-phosphate isomerase